jgi:hypothetical protein
MRSVILLVVGAAWVAVLLPPLLRSRLENRPGSSIDSFQSRLSSLQRSVPSAGVRSMARPLAGSHRTETRYTVRPVDVRYAPQRVGSMSQRVGQRSSATGYSSGYRSTLTSPPRPEIRGQGIRDRSVHQFEQRSHQSPQGLQRRDETQLISRQQAAAGTRQRQVAPRQQRGTVKQRRQNILFSLVLMTSLSGLFVAAAGSAASKAMLALSACALVGYSCMVAQVRRAELGHEDYYGYEAA